MKKHFIPLAILLCAAISGCKTGTAPVASATGGIPDRPEKLTFPALNFQPPDAAQFRVQLQSGPVAYVVPDRELPLVNISILIRTGDYLTPPGKEGLPSLTGDLLKEGGAGDMTASELEERLAFLAAQLGTSVDAVSGKVSLNLLSKDLDEGLLILRDVLTKPRFQEDKLTLNKQQITQAMRQRNDDSSTIEASELGHLAYGSPFWMNRDVTAKSLDSITREDLVQFHQRWFHPRNFTIAVSGDFDRAAMIAKLEKLFSDWPFKGETPPPVPAKIQFAAAGTYLVNKEVNQGRVSILLPGMMRDDPDYYAASLMNDILGGGGFTSRIVNRVRTEEGLAYSAGSALPGGIYFSQPFIATFQTKSRTVPFAVSLVFNEMKRIASEPVTDQELKTAVNAKIETFPRAFASKGQIAGLYAQEEFTGRYASNPAYYKTYRDKIRAVTKADIQRVAKRLLTAEQAAILIVGNRDEILLRNPDHPQQLHDFLGGKVTELPLRDPMTLEPNGAPKPIAKPAEAK